MHDQAQRQAEQTQEVQGVSEFRGAGHDFRFLSFTKTIGDANIRMMLHQVMQQTAQFFSFMAIIMVLQAHQAFDNIHINQAHGYVMKTIRAAVSRMEVNEEEAEGMHFLTWETYGVVARAGTETDGNFAQNFPNKGMGNMITMCPQHVLQPESATYVDGAVKQFMFVTTRFKMCTRAKPENKGTAKCDTNAQAGTVSFGTGLRANETSTRPKSLIKTAYERLAVHELVQQEVMEFQQRSSEKCNKCKQEGQSSKVQKHSVVPNLPIFPAVDVAGFEMGTHISKFSFEQTECVPVVVELQDANLQGRPPRQTYCNLYAQRQQKEMVPRRLEQTRKVHKS